jgi:hypothetical protein
MSITRRDFLAGGSAAGIGLALAANAQPPTFRRDSVRQGISGTLPQAK